jgi:hypothetical protein
VFPHAAAAEPAEAAAPDDRTQVVPPAADPDAAASEVAPPTADPDAAASEDPLVSRRSGT